MNLIYEEVVEICESYDFVLRHEALIDTYNTLEHLLNVFSDYSNSLVKNKIDKRDEYKEYFKYVSNIEELQKQIVSSMKTNFRNEKRIVNIMFNKRLILSSNIRTRLSPKYEWDIEEHLFDSIKINPALNEDKKITEYDLQIKQILQKNLIIYIKNYIDNLKKFRQEIELFKHKMIEKEDKEKTLNYIQEKLSEYTERKENLSKIAEKISKNLGMKLNEENIEITNKIVMLTIID